LGKVLVQNARTAIQSVDVVLFVVDGFVESEGAIDILSKFSAISAFR
jgi:GTPase Era involved in 16S rRNA processing